MSCTHKQRLAKARQADLRARRKQSGLTEVRGIWAKPEHHDAVKQTARLITGDLGRIRPDDEYTVGAEVRQDDPTPWCAYCRAKRAADCRCGPIAPNE